MSNMQVMTLTEFDEYKESLRIKASNLRHAGKTNIEILAMLIVDLKMDDQHLFTGEQFSEITDLCWEVRQ